MKPIVSSFFCRAGFALLMPVLISVLISVPAQAGTPPPHAMTTFTAEQVACIGPGSITGTVVDATTIVTPRFSAYKCSSHYPVPIAVQFKDPAAAMKVGDTVTLKGQLISVQDAHRDAYGLVLKNAQIVQ
jgi:hypothetical protein